MLRADWAPRVDGATSSSSVSPSESDAPIFMMRAESGRGFFGPPPPLPAAPPRPSVLSGTLPRALPYPNAAAAVLKLRFTPSSVAAPRAEGADEGAGASAADAAGAAEDAGVFIAGAIAGAGGAHRPAEDNAGATQEWPRCSGELGCTVSSALQLRALAWEGAQPGARPAAGAGALADELRRDAVAAPGSAPRGSDAEHDGAGA